RLRAGRRLPQFSHLAAGTNPFPLRLRPQLERTQRLGGASAQRADELAVILVGDLPGAVVELELLERGECAVAFLRELERAAFERPELDDPIVVGHGFAKKRTRDEEHAGEGQ